MPRAGVEFRAGRQMLATKTRQGGMAKRRRPLDSVAASRLTRTRAKSIFAKRRSHLRPQPRPRPHHRSRPRLHPLPHLRLHPHLRPHLHPYPCCGHGRSCACTRTRTKRRPHLHLQPHLYPRRGHGRKKGPRCPPHRRTHLRKIATGREVKFNFLRIWPLLANNPRS